MPCPKEWRIYLGIAFASAVVTTAILTAINFGLRIHYRHSKECDNGDELYYRATDRCYPKGLPGPCSETLVFVERETGSVFGQCACPYTEHDRAMLFDGDTNRCYFIFSQAFCKDGFWLNITRDTTGKGKIFCEENRCLNYFPDSDTIADEIVPLAGGECGILNQPGPGCQENDVIKFYKNKILPTCLVPKPISASVGAGVMVKPISSCPLGSYQNIIGKCQLDFEF